jgi:hypothetical protein
MRKILEIGLEDELVLRLAWDDGRASVLLVDPLVREDVERWIRDGLMEFVREDGSLSQRITRANEPEFLDRIAGSVASQFGYETRVY